MNDYLPFDVIDIEMISIPYRDTYGHVLAFRTTDSDNSPQ